MVSFLVFRYLLLLVFCLWKCLIKVWCCCLWVIGLFLLFGSLLWVSMLLLLWFMWLNVYSIYCMYFFMLILLLLLLFMCCR